MIWDALAFKQKKRQSPLGAETSSVADRISAARAHKQQGILDAAEKLIRRYGHAKTSIEDISRVIGTSRADIYRFFPTKEALDQKVFARHAHFILERARDAARCETDGSAPLLAAIISLVEQTASMIECDPHIQQLFATAFAKDWEAAHIYISQVLALIEAIISDGMKTGHFAVSDPAVAAQRVLTSVIVFIHPTLVTEAALKFPSLIPSPLTQIEPILTYLSASGRK